MTDRRMQAAQLVRLGRRAIRKPPRVVVARLAAELRVELDRRAAPRRGRSLDEVGLLRLYESDSLDALWNELVEAPYPFARTRAEVEQIEQVLPGERARILESAERALARRVDLLGSGPVELGTPLDWHADPKTGRRWELGYGRRLDYVNLDEPSDVKLPWEISRLQWALPAAQAYVLTGDERYAEGVRALLAEWIEANPYTLGVNWAIAMEPAFRIFTWGYLFHALGGSDAWSDASFRLAFLRSLTLHAVFVDRNIERADVNGNHFTADAAALVAAGCLFAGRGPAAAWRARGWTELVDELPRQILADGVDFEASTAYHRLVVELFLVAAVQHRAAGGEVPPLYRDRLLAAADFAEAYVHADGTTPLWGDSDDARVLPLGGLPPGDHGYLPGVVRRAFGSESSGAGGAEEAWLLGPPATAPAAPGERRSQGFPDGGVYVLASGTDHVFVDAGPVGLAGRGGHGHNDCLSFEAVLDGVAVVTDCGSYVYTASPSWRDRFRSTAFHNTPHVDDVEQNRIDPQSLWRLSDDARPEVTQFDEAVNLIRARHDGYERLPSPVTVERTLRLESRLHALLVADELAGPGEHDVEVPLHLARGVSVTETAPGRCRVEAEGRSFEIAWQPSEDWTLEVGSGWVSPSYGVKHELVRLAFRRTGPLRPLTVVIAPSEHAAEAWEALAG